MVLFDISHHLRVWGSDSDALLKSLQWILFLLSIPLRLFPGHHPEASWQQNSCKWKMWRIEIPTNCGSSMTCSLLPRLILKDNQNPNGQSANGSRWKAFNIIQHWKPIIGKPGQKLEPSRSKIAKSPLVESNGSNMWRGEHVPSEIKEEL